MIAHDASFRDPSGYVFTENGVLKRFISPLYFKRYKALTSSGFYKKLIDKKWLIPHEELENSADKITIQPTEIPFITYPYEWSFLQYKHAALLTLKIQKFCLQHGFTLKDASAFNISFHNGKPVFIDTLSFDFYIDDTPWNAYKQFITHFLSPLVLAKYHGVDFLKNMSNYIDGVPLELTSSLLPFKTKFSPFLYTNIHLLATYETKYREKTTSNTKVKKLSKKAQVSIIDNLYYYIKKLRISDKTQWGDYYDKTNYDEGSFKEKTTIVNEWVSDIKPNKILDIGGNDGTFSRKLPQENTTILVADIDAMAVDENYKNVLLAKEKHILPLVFDVLNPTPAIGFNNTERSSFLSRLHHFNPDLVMALALIHHITLSGNVPFSKSAAFFASFCKYLLIEFPAEEDSQVQFLLNRKGTVKHHFNFYNKTNFEDAYQTFFTVEKQKPIKNTHRTLYLLKNK